LPVLETERLCKVALPTGTLPKLMVAGVI